MICTKCKTDKDRGEFYELRMTGQPKRLASYCKKCANTETTKRQRVNKIKSVEYLGGKCMKCGYCKSLYALSLHHRDPKTKDKNYSRHKLWSWERIKKELGKCDLLCHNCHAETHEVINLSVALV